MNFYLILQGIVSANGVPGAPASAGLFEQIERRYTITLPPDVKQNYLVMNGSDDYTSGNDSWIRFWGLEEWRPAIEEFPDDRAAQALSEKAFICADYAAECVFYAIDLDDQSPTFGHVYGLGATRPGLAGSSFTEFIAHVAADSDELHSYG